MALKPDWTKVKLEAQKVGEAPFKAKQAIHFYISCSLVHLLYIDIDMILTSRCFSLSPPTLHQILSELFSSVFENEELPTPLHPLQGGLTNRLIKPAALLRSLRPLTQRPGSSSQVSAHGQQSEHPEEF